MLSLAILRTQQTKNRLSAAFSTGNTGLTTIPFNLNFPTELFLSFLSFLFLFVSFVGFTKVVLS